MLENVSSVYTNILQKFALFHVKKFRLLWQSLLPNLAILIFRTWQPWRHRHISNFPLHDVLSKLYRFLITLFKTFVIHDILMNCLYGIKSSSLNISLHLTPTQTDPFSLKIAKSSTTSLLPRFRNFGFVPSKKCHVTQSCALRKKTKRQRSFQLQFSKSSSTLDDMS